MTDTGGGMDAETLDRAFEPFFTTKKPGRGNGLGLATARRLARQEGGTIVAESEPGKGTRVCVRLPRVPTGHPIKFESRGDFMTTAALSTPNPVQMEAANFLNLLIVDDERAIREVCREVAQSLGFNTAVADSAEHAYRLLETAEHRCCAARPEAAGRGRAGGAASDRRTQAGCGHRGGHRIRHGAIRGPGHEERRLRLRDQAFQHGRAESCCWSGCRAI